MPYYSIKARDKNRDYFRIHYNFNSSALLITTLNKIQIESAILGRNKFLLLIARITIKYKGSLAFIIKFLDLSNCAKDYKRNYIIYAIELGILNALYIATPLNNDILISCEYRSKGLFSKEAFSKVYKVVKIQDREQYTIKILKGGKREIIEIKIISKLYYINIPINFLCYILTLEKENIIKYKRAFKLYSG